MALWFSASAVIPALVAEYRLTGFAQAALTSGVQAGFVVGCLVSAYFGLPGPGRSAPPLRDLHAHRRVRERAAARRRSLVVDRPHAARRDGHRDGGRLPGGHEARRVLGEGRHGPDGRHPGRRAHAGLGDAASLHHRRRRRLAVCGDPVDLFGLRGGDADPLCGHRPQSRAGAAVRSARRAVGVARCAAAARQPGLPRPHVGALRDVGVDRRLPRRELRALAAAGNGGRWRRSSWRSPPLRPAASGSVAAGFLADRLGRTTITIAAMAISGTCAATIGFLYGGDPGWLIASASSGASASSPTPRSSPRPSRSWPIPRGWARC